MSLLSVHPSDPDIDIVHDLQPGDVVLMVCSVDRYAGKFAPLNRVEFHPDPVTVESVEDLGAGYSLLRLTEWWRPVDDKVVLCRTDHLVLRTRPDAEETP